MGTNPAFPDSVRSGNGIADQPARRQIGLMLTIPIRLLAATAMLIALPAMAQETPPATPVEPVEALPLEPLPAREFAGPAVVLDSMTLQVEGETLVLYGLQRFSGDWRTEAAGRSVLEALVEQGDVRCVEAGRDRYRRLLALCSAGDTADLSEAMLAAGMGLVDRSVTRRPNADAGLADRYDDAVRAARDGSAGLWSLVPGYEPPAPEAPMPPPPDFWDRVERYQAGLAVLIGFVLVAIVLAMTGRRRR